MVKKMKETRRLYKCFICCTQMTEISTKNITTYALLWQNVYASTLKLFLLWLSQLLKKISISLWSFVRDVANKFIQENFNPNDRPFVVSATVALQTTSMTIKPSLFPYLLSPYAEKPRVSWFRHTGDIYAKLSCFRCCMPENWLSKQKYLTRYYSYV